MVADELAESMDSIYDAQIIVVKPQICIRFDF
jgi:hypothetical protein